MVRSLSWIDQEELNEALAMALQHRSGEAGAVQATWFASRQAQRVTDGTIHEAQRVTLASNTVAVAPNEKRTIPEDYKPTKGTLSTRIKEYLQWAIGRTECRQAFVADADGLVLIEFSSHPDLVAIASMFVSVLNRIDASLSSPITGSVTIGLESGEFLHVVQAETGLGPYALGFTVPRPADRETVESARNGLISAMGQMETGEN